MFLVRNNIYIFVCLYIVFPVDVHLKRLIVVKCI